MLDEPDDRGPPVRVARGRDDARRLVQEDVRKRLRQEEPPVEVDDVAFLDVGAEAGGDAVDADAAALDELVRAPPGGDPGAREVGVQAHLGSFILATVPSPTRTDFPIRIASGYQS